MTDVLFFGRLAELTGTPTVHVEEAGDTELLRQRMLERFPNLVDVSFLIAVDNTVVHGAVDIPTGSRVAFLPPFSGG